jgi:hypothetical protein
MHDVLVGHMGSDHNHCTGGEMEVQLPVDPLFDPLQPPTHEGGVD